MHVQLSVYHVYTFAWILAIASATLTAVVLNSTFAAVTALTTATANTQRGVGLEQMMALNLTVAGSLHRMQIESSDRLTDIHQYTGPLTADEMLPFVVLDQITPQVLATWAPYIRSADEVYGYVANFLYPVNATVAGYTYDNSIQIYADIKANFSRQYMVSLTNRTDKLEYAFEIDFSLTEPPRVGVELYSFEWFHSSLTQALVEDDFFFAPWPWAASDGHSFWYFTHQRYFRAHGVEGTVMTLATGFAWLDIMQSIRVPQAEFVIFDSNNMTLMATAAAELQRLQTCQGNFVNGMIPTTCIGAQSSVHPTPEIRAVFNGLYDASWTDVHAPVGAFRCATVKISGQDYLAVYGTLVSRNQLRMTAVWYQPQATVQTGQPWVIPLSCCMTVVSTIALSVLGIMGILKPLMRLGRGMRFVADSLKRGDTGVVVQAREPCMLVEVDRIGQDFETIAVDFLGFNSSNGRDATFAPKDANKPFAVVFTDIESSSMLWGKDPEEMARCLRLHHEIIRSLIQKYHMFEVKTVGDSFMVTSCSPDDALRFAAELQGALYMCDWDWPEAEDVYQQKHVFLPHGGSRLAYEDLWHGLRVRVGIHFGHGDIVLDEVTKGYDYYGAVVNTASRIETAGHGGQILVSEAVLRALATPLSSQDFIVKALGVHPLRGIQDPPALFEVLPASLVGRTFPPLRTSTDSLAENIPDIIMDMSAYVTPMREGCTNRRASGSRTSHTYSASPSVVAGAEALAQTHSLVRDGTVAAQILLKQLLRTRETLMDSLRPLPTHQQTATLKTICRAWGVPAPPGTEDLTPALLTVAQRMSETPKSVARLAAKRQASP